MSFVKTALVFVGVAGVLALAYFAFCPCAAKKCCPNGVCPVVAPKCDKKCCDKKDVKCAGDCCCCCEEGKCHCCDNGVCRPCCDTCTCCKK